MKKSTLGLLIGIICIGLLSLIIASTRPRPVAESTNNTSTFSTEEVAKHSSSTDCWMIIGDSVYDVTAYVRNHPGGSEILRGCGKDATELFNTRRDGGERVGSGTSHTSSAKSTLESFRIGSLTN